MANRRTIPLSRIRTDGWFENLAESIQSFHTLCDVVGERFFAFALIVGARVTSLMIDRFNPDQSLVEFSFGGVDEPSTSAPERLTVLEFRQRLVSTLLAAEPEGPPTDEIGDDLEALQRHIGPRTLLLAPLYGFGLTELAVADGQTTLHTERDGAVESFTVMAFRERLLEQVRADLEGGVERQSGTAIDLNDVDKAEEAAADDAWDRVIQLLGKWATPLAIYWRTPEGQMLPDKARQRIAEGLGLLGTACAKLGDDSQGEEVLRLAVQYAQEGEAASAIFRRLGRMFIEGERWGEAIGPLRRAKVLGAEPDVLLQLAQAFIERDRHVAAWAYLLEAERRGAPAARRGELLDLVKAKLGTGYERWIKFVD